MTSSAVMESVVEGKAEFDKPIDREKVNSNLNSVFYTVIAVVYPCVCVVVLKEISFMKLQIVVL